MLNARYVLEARAWQQVTQLITGNINSSAAPQSHCTWRFEETRTPFAAVFWSTKKQGRITRPCPVMDIPGASLSLICIDLLHTWHLGPLARLAALIFHSVIESTAYNERFGYLSAEEWRSTGILRLRTVGSCFCLASQATLLQTHTS